MSKSNDKSRDKSNDKLLTEAGKNMTPTERKRLKLALKPRHNVLSLRFNAGDIANWRIAAAMKPDRSLTDFMEEVLNQRAGEEIRRARGR